jgi:transposase-like protein
MTDKMAIRTFPTAYKLKAIKRAEGGEGVLPVARKLGISRKLLHDWIKAWKADGPAGLGKACSTQMEAYLITARIPGLYDARPLLLCPYEGSDSTIAQIASEVLSLTKVNWNSTQMNQKLPIPIRAARAVGEVP